MTGEEDKFDGILTQMLNDKGGYEGFFENIFSFLRRRTDFFAKSKEGEGIIAAAGKRQADLYFSNKKQAEELQKSKKTQPEPKQAQQKEVLHTEEPKKNTEKDEEEKAPEASEGSKIAPNKGNGSSTTDYYWTQTLEEVSVQIPLQSSDNKKALSIELGIKSCKIMRKDGTRVYVDDEWCGKIHVDESSWVIVDDEKGKTLQLSLLKWKNDTLWWDCLVKKEPKIDTQKVNPEPGKLSDLDGEARTTVEKMMFDMRQKQMGLPTSDELEKREKLKEFMKAHPELDFSNAKFA